MPSSYLRDTTPARIVADFMAGMTDDYFSNEFKTRFMPESYGYALDAGRAQ